MKAAEWISLAGVVVAAVSAIWAIISARRAASAQGEAARYQAAAEQNAERATQAAERAAVAQRESAAAAQRSADALEQQNRLAEERAEQAEGAPWSIRHNYGDTYDLVNTTNTAKFGVQIAGPGVAGEHIAVERIDGQSSAQFLIAPFGAEFNRVDVTWHRREDLSDNPPQRWTGSKPPKR